MNKSILQEVNDWAVLDFDEFKKSPSPTLKKTEKEEISHLNLFLMKIKKCLHH